jgi:tetratricopeptide (TPR) repeat protein
MLERTARSRFASNLLLFLVAFGFRQVYLLESMANPLFGAPQVDAGSYDTWARSLGPGHWLWTEVGNYTVVFPLWLAAIGHATAWDPAAMGTVQALVGACAVVLLAELATRIFGREVGMVAGLLWGTCWLSIIYELEGFAEGFANALQILALYLLVRWPRSVAIGWLAGVAMGVAVAARANLLLAAPVAMLMAAFPDAAERSLRRALVFGIGLALVLAPIIWRNHELTGLWVLRGQAPWSFYAAVEPAFHGFHPPPGIAFDKYMNQPVAHGAASFAEIEHWWTAKAWDVIERDPWAVIETTVRRVFLFLNARELPQDIDVHAYRAYSSLLSIPLPSFGLLLPLAVGALALGTRSRSAQWLALYTVVVAISILPFKVSDRYRLPVSVLLAIWAAVFVVEVLRSGGAFGALHRRALAFAALTALVSWPDWPRASELSTTRHDWQVGHHFLMLGRYDEARVQFERSMAAVSWDADSAGELGALFAREHEDDDAAAAFEEALRREPDYVDALTGLGRLRWGQGRLEEAEALTERAIALAPADPFVNLLAADLAEAKGDIARGIELREKALRCHASPVEHVGLAVRELQLGRADDALRTLLEAPSPQRELYTGLVAALAGRIEVARDALQEVASTSGPTAVRARALLGDDTPGPVDCFDRGVRELLAGRSFDYSRCPDDGRPARPAETLTLLRIARALPY